MSPDIHEVFALEVSFILVTYLIDSLKEEKNFRVTKTFEKGRKYHIFVSFHIFLFQRNILSELSVKLKCEKALENVV